MLAADTHEVGLPSASRATRLAAAYYALAQTSWPMLALFSIAELDRPGG
eukprot:CAMPEP_0202085084 /NCGR_PEP_ID=MMETSP0964-20121228/29659_1 /ASSEMBLY_ACC=CAM_ASM_000500 /TAXON_ID=4773 /ORGANISM="Schizochytrium aggregatum, Strain ATCC28209" /LENGTH=48 /DNA_ID= /DNA_START= /DNA_END= /DNA_ORIENTATION=